MRLCNDHLNDWHKYIREHELYLEQDDLSIEIHLAAERLDEKQMKILADEMRRNGRLLYALGETWVDAAIISHAMDDERDIREEAKKVRDLTMLDLDKEEL